jgi:hypothetical protein
VILFYEWPEWLPGRQFAPQALRLVVFFLALCPCLNPCLQVPFKHVCSAHLAWRLLDGLGCTKDHDRAYGIVANQDCIHCKGVLARCLVGGYGVLKDVRQGSVLAQESAEAESKYGQYIWGWLLDFKQSGGDKKKARECYQLATRQGLDFSHIVHQAPSTPARKFPNTASRTASRPIPSVLQQPQHPSAISFNRRSRPQQPKQTKTFAPGQCCHGKRKSFCRECKGGGICKHDKQRQWCVQCKPLGTGARCIHGKQKSRCVDCGGSGICAHRKLKHRCAICKKRSVIARR